jgi:hypothetical protein
MQLFLKTFCLKTNLFVVMALCATIKVFSIFKKFKFVVPLWAR